MINAVQERWMERAMRRLLLVAALFGAVQGAQAADLPDLPILRGAVSEGLTTSRVNWQGAYVGFQGGYGTANMNLAGSANIATNAIQPQTGLGPDRYPVLGEASPTGSGFGGFAGYNWQFEDVVVGIDASYLHGNNFKGTSTTGNFGVGAGNRYVSSATGSANVHDFGSLRARGGYMIGSFLPYATLGVGMGNVEITSTATSFDTLSPAVASSTLKQDRFMYGYSAGVGIDVMLIGCLFLRAEYEYQRMKSAVDSTTPAVDIGMNTVRAGLGYKF
jgi:opacity protein-like surface antigen